MSPQQKVKQKRWTVWGVIDIQVEHDEATLFLSSGGDGIAEHRHEVSQHCRI
jgi:hypothetical protein